MPKETRKPKSEWRPELADAPREDPAFWTWRGEPGADPMMLREGPDSSATPPTDLMERTAQFGEAIVRFVKKIPRGPDHPENNRLVDQLVGAGTSIGANYCEADDAVSGKDFDHREWVAPDRSVFGFRISFGFRPSDFGFHLCY